MERMQLQSSNYEVTLHFSSCADLHFITSVGSAFPQLHFLLKSCLTASLCVCAWPRVVHICIAWRIKLIICIYTLNCSRSLPYFTLLYSAFHHSGVGKWLPAAAGKAKAGKAHSDCGWMCGCAGKTEILWEHVPYLSASAVVIHYEEALYQAYAPFTVKCSEWPRADRAAGAMSSETDCIAAAHCEWIDRTVAHTDRHAVLLFIIIIF